MFKEIFCPQCGDNTHELHEGCCEQCWNENQAALDRHNQEYDHWNRMDSERREQAIREAMNQ